MLQSDSNPTLAGAVNRRFPRLQDGNWMLEEHSVAVGCPGPGSQTRSFSKMGRLPGEVHEQGKYEFNTPVLHGNLQQC